MTLNDYDGSGTEMMLDNESVINSLPTYSFPDSAENKGHWKVGFGNTWCSCSECGGNGSTNWSYCPWCGSDMRGEADEQ